MGKIAVLLTCYNRKKKTQECLSSLFGITNDVDVFLVDDKSTDGTSEMVRKLFPQVHLIEGSGNLFWTRGMYWAWKEALKGEYDFYVWLNDDVILYSSLFDELFSCYKIAGPLCVITGIIVDVNTKHVIYGGTDENNKLYMCDGQMHLVHDMNGNVVLVPNCVVKQIGIIDPHFIQGGGDTDYGYTALENGIKVYTTRNVVGEGYANEIDRIHKWDTNLFERYKFLYSPFGMNPRLGFYFYKKHYGYRKAIMYWFYLHVINLLPDFIVCKIHKRIQ